MEKEEIQNEDLSLLLEMSESLDCSTYLSKLSKEGLIALLFCAISEIDSLNVKLLNGDDCLDERDAFDQLDDKQIILSKLATDLINNLKITIEIEE
ncbi:MAG: hypothetical protein IJZ29_04340 [Clostridia bacterium]|nr:hypothetical protein [Clostridia bacterium]